MTTSQLTHWAGQFGKNYTDRNDLGIKGMEDLAQRNFGQTQSQIYRQLLKGININTILEVGCNVGHQLGILQQLNPNYQLTGVEPQTYALKLARKNYPNIIFIKGNIFKLPLPDHSFDLVFTKGVLIHLHPQDLPRALKEIYRVSKHFIAGLEYYAKRHTQVIYRGHQNLLWKGDFQRQYLKRFSNLQSRRSRLIEFNHQIYDKAGLFEQHFLLRKL